MVAGDEPEEARLVELKARPAGTLLVHEVYRSLQGEGTRAGRECLFVRTSGCHLRCQYCDTPHAFHEGEAREVDALLEELKAEGSALILVTGGEPLLQPEVLPLMRGLLDAGREVLLETSGGVSTRGVDERVVTILDVKTPGSGEAARNVTDNYERLRAHDEVKFVLTSEDDYRWALAHVEEHRLHERCTVLLSPCAGQLEARALADWMVRDRPPARLNLQLHKILWGDRRGV